MNLRLATLDDAASIWDVHVNAIRVLCASDYTPRQITAWLEPKKPSDYHRPISEQRIFVAEFSGCLAGFGEFGTKEIHAIYVHPRFARRKVGTLLFHRLIAELGSRGVLRISLDASLTSVPFYLALGCTAGEAVTHCLRSGVEILCIQMIFELSETPVRQPFSGTQFP
ncbi:MAG TPA: GNAT family N-acetyltransferase [Opitutaceae bacterium]|nr:GNAT family N-acetyltransferase [Opitutaceae bacterium]